MILVDTGPVLALLRGDDRDHTRCAVLLSAAAQPPLLPVPVLTAVCQVLERHHGTRAEQAFLSDVRDGLFSLVATIPTDLTRIAELIADPVPIGQHPDPDPAGAGAGGGRPGLVQASVIAAAERLHITTIATLDPRPFTTSRDRGPSPFTVLP